MGVWGKIAKYAALGGAGLATAMTGGAAAPLIGVAGKVGQIADMVGKGGQIAAGIAGGEEKGMVDQSHINSAQNTDAVNRFRALDSATLDRQQMVNKALQDEFTNKMKLNDTEATRPDLRLAQAKAGDIAANVQDARYDNIPRVQAVHMSGGLRPSLFGPNTRAAGQKMSDMALMKMGNEGLPTAPTAMTKASDIPMPNMPDFLGAPKPSVAGQIAGYAAPAMNLASQWLVPQKKQPQLPGMNGGVAADNTYGDFA
jgi:hypothetical protein